MAWASTFAGQRTEVRDAGGGRKIELVYNAAGQVVETRTLDATGKILVRAEIEYRPGYYSPQHTTTDYWTDGKSIRSVARVTFDENGNFTSELKRVFDESGKQTAGTRVTHEPFTGIYKCARWNNSPGDYQPVHCPAGEGGGEAGEEAKELTYGEALKELQVARQIQDKAKGKPPEEESSTHTTSGVTPVGILLPAPLLPSERVSGTVTLNPQNYGDSPGLRVLQIEIPAVSNGQAFDLRDWDLQAEGENPQPADAPFTFTIPSNASEFSLRLMPRGESSRAVSQRVKVDSAKKESTPPRMREFEAAALCVKGNVCALRGPFGGDSAKTVIAVDDQPVRILAESRDAAYITLPATAKPGMSHLIVAEGSQLAALPVDVAEVSFSQASGDLQEGKYLLIHATLYGPEDLPDRMWNSGSFPPEASVEAVRSMVPDFDLGQYREHGTVLFIIRNTTPEQFSLRGSKNQMFALPLVPDSFERGEFRFQFVVEAKQSGQFALRGDAIPFLAPVKAHQFATRGK